MKILNYLKSKSTSKIAFLLLGIASIIWFLIRVIPKPSRASYPCMRATAPFISAFILYFISIGTSILVFKKTNKNFMQSKFMLFFVFSFVVIFSFTPVNSPKSATLVNASYFEANTPMGVAKGIFPGRVAWINDPNATNESMSNTDGDYWFMDQNCNQAVVSSMLENGIKGIAGKESITEAWDAIFKYFNNNHGKGNVGYTAGEQIAINLSSILN
jgi:hypothetical protein